MQSKWLFFSIALISLALGILPEFISDEMKAKAKSVFGNHYDVAWLVIFLLVGILFVYLTWKQFKSEKNNSLQNSTVPIAPAKFEEKKGSSLVVEELKAKSIDIKTVQKESSASFKKIKSKKGGIKIDVKQK